MATYHYEHSTWDADAAWNGETGRFIIPSTALTGTSTQFRLTLAYRSSSWTFDKVYLGHAAAVGDVYDFDGSQVQVLFSGAAGGTVGVGGLESDTTVFNFDPTKNVVVAIYFSGASSPPRDSTSTGYGVYYKAGDDAATTDASGYSASGYNGQIECVASIEDLDVIVCIVPALALADTFVTPSITTVFPPSLSFTDSFVAPLTLPMRVPALSLADTAVAPVFNLMIIPPALSLADTFTAPGIGRKEFVPSMSKTDCLVVPEVNIAVHGRTRMKVNLV